MTNNDSGPGGNTPPWLVESARLTAFPEPGISFSSDDWWEKLVGQPPDEKREKPRQATVTHAGQHGRGKLGISVSPARIQIQLSAQIEGEEESETEIAFPVLGSFPEAATDFQALGRQWLELDDIPSIVRLAFGCVLLSPVDSKVEGYQQLAALLPALEIDAKNTSDLMYRINRPRESTVSIDPPLRVNRLSHWSVAHFKYFAIVASQAETPLEQQAMASLNATRLELDINTRPDHKEPLPRGRITEIWDELCDLALEIAQNGDTP